MRKITRRNKNIQRAAIHKTQVGCFGRGIQVCGIVADQDRTVGQDVSPQVYGPVTPLALQRYVLLQSFA